MFAWRCKRSKAIASAAQTVKGLSCRAVAADPELAAFMAKMSGYAKVPLSALSAVWRWEQGKRVAVPRAESPKSTSGMTKIAGGPLRFSVKGIEIE